MVPTQIDPDQVNEYLYHLSESYNPPSLSAFKFAVYGLRFAYKACNMPGHAIQLPRIKRDKRLPVVLSRAEVRRLIDSPQLLKHRVVIALLYGCGLRNREVRNLKIIDLDFDRRTVHIKRGKCNKDRYVPLSAFLVDLIKQYLKMEKPVNWLFNGRPGHQFAKHNFCNYSQRGLQWVVKHHARKAEINKEVSPHTLRHTFATHLIEDGLDILTIKELLGHSYIETTMVYLHVAQYDKSRGYSPLDTLYGIAEKKKLSIACPFLLKELNPDN
jgi:integrase/recombinase XerD